MDCGGGGGDPQACRGLETAGAHDPGLLHQPPHVPLGFPPALQAEDHEGGLGRLVPVVLGAGDSGGLP